MASFGVIRLRLHRVTNKSDTAVTEPRSRRRSALADPLAAGEPLLRLSRKEAMSSSFGPMDAASDARAGEKRRRNHICWVYGSVAEFHERAAVFLREGLAMGQRVAYLAGESVEQARAELNDAADFQDLLGAPAFAVSAVDDWYRAVQTATAAGQLETYTAAARSAVADGYTGLRVAVEATGLAGTGPQREMFARYEHLMDRCMVDEPFAALCGYDGAELGTPAAAELACLHPQSSPQAAPFQWWAASDADMGLSGEIDIDSVDLFDTTMARTLPLLPGPQVVVDAHQLTYIDHRGLLALEGHARANSLQIVLHTKVPTVRRLAAALQLHAVRPTLSTEDERDP